MELEVDSGLTFVKMAELTFVEVPITFNGQSLYLVAMQEHGSVVYRTNDGKYLLHLDDFTEEKYESLFYDSEYSI